MTNKDIPSLTKLVVFWKPSHKRGSNTFYSYDRAQDIKSGNPTYGIEGLIKRLVRGKLVGQYRIAILYDNRTNLEVKRYNQYGLAIS